MKMKRRSTTIRFSVLAVRVQSGEVQSGSMIGRLTFTICCTPSLARCLPPLSRPFLSRFTRLFRRSHCTFSLFLVLSIYIARASAFTLRVVPSPPAWYQFQPKWRIAHAGGAHARMHACLPIFHSTSPQWDDRFTSRTKVCELFERKIDVEEREFSFCRRCKIVSASRDPSLRL